MSKLIIEGGFSLNGEITVSGNKNAALPIIAATALTEETCVINNLPAIRDVEAMLKILDNLGKSILYKNSGTCEISGSINKSVIEDQLAKNLRASILYLSVILAQMSEVHMSPPGGCVIGRRNVDSHFDVASTLGAEININDEGYHAKWVKPGPGKIFLKESSVTATENALMLAAAIPGETIIENAACEPHVTDLANVLKKMGANIFGAGTNKIQITGKKKLSGFEHSIMPDPIEAGTFAIAAACTKGELIIKEAYKSHLQITEYHLKKMGVQLEFLDDNTMRVHASQLISGTNKIQVGLWPGFPTDLMSPMIVLATQSEGTTLCHDWMFESRMFFVDKLIAMGAQITQCDPHRVLVVGPTSLKAQELSSPDIRAGIALVIAALCAMGTSTIDHAELVDRGYQDIDNRLNDLGAKIQRFD